MTIYLEPDKLESYILRYCDRLEEKGLTEQEIDIRVENHLHNVIVKYTKVQQDRMWKELLDTVGQRGGISVLLEYCSLPHSEFQHYSQVHKRSYSKGNVSDNMAKKELSPDNYKYYKYIQSKGLNKNLYHKRLNAKVYKDK